MNKIILCTVILFSVIGCGPDEPVDVPDIVIPENIVVVAQQGFDVRLADISTITREVKVTDYSSQFVDARGRKFVQHTESHVTIIYYEYPRIELWRKYFDSNEILTGIIHEIESDEYIFDTTSDDDYGYLILDKINPDESVDRKLIATSLSNSSQSTTVDISKTVNELFGSNYIHVDEGHLLVYSTDLNQSINMYKIDIENSTKTDSISLDDNPVIVVAEGVIHTFNQNNTYISYSISEFKQLNASDFDFNIISSPEGFKESFMKENRLIIDFPYAQPFPLVSAPVEIQIPEGNMINDENYLFQLVSKFEQDKGFNIMLRAYSVNQESGIIVFGYQSFQGISIGSVGGLLITNFKGDLLDNIELDVIPTKIILR